MSVPTATALRLMQERNQPTCEVQGCDNPAEEAHHVFVGRNKHHREFDVDENLQLVCIDCHKFSGKACNWENRLAFWDKQCERFGHDWMVEWYSGLPIKCKEKAYK